MPLLRAEQGVADPEALGTWHSALSNALSADVPHDLLGLWLYPSQGGAILLGPEALAQDDLAIPLPAPQVPPAQIAVIEAIIHDAGYGSVVGLPIRSGRRDVGLMLVAALRPSCYGDAARATLENVARQLSPMLGRMSRQWGVPAPDGAEPRATCVASLVDAVAQAGTRAGSPQLYVAELGRALEPLLPHDHVELLVADGGGERAYRLGQHAGGALWSDPSLALDRQLLDLERLFGARQTLLIGDTYRSPHWPRGYFTVEDPAGAELRSIVGVRVRGSHGVSAFLLAGSASAEMYREDDAALLDRVGRLIGAQVTLLVTMAASVALPPGAQPKVAPVPAGGGVVESPSLLEAAELFAIGSDFAEATRRATDLAARLLPFDDIHFALRLSEGDRVVLIAPGERRPLPDLPLIPVAGTALAAVLQGEIPHSFVVVEGEARLLVPLRVAGRVHGALVLTARHPAILREVHIRPAQQLADIVACHFELLRRTALLPPPYLPGWKKLR